VAGSTKEKIAAANARISSCLEESRRALRGERNFGPEDLRAMAQPISEMAPILADAKKLEAAQPDVAVELVRYKEQLRELHTALNQVRTMLAGRCAGIGETRKHLDAVSRWAAATRLIR
jgi:hypothetical protein